MIPPATLLQNRYLVLEQVGKGGMGVVYKATDQRFGSTVALKEIFLDAPHLRKAFEREARLLNHLRHPALPRVSDHFTEEDGQFLVMEFIPGADLWEMLKEKRVPFPLASVLEWADQLLDALDYLHNHEPSIIHRDIKPQNLKLTERNRIVLLDFGLAKGTLSQASRVTETGSVFGYSYHYAPLEQMQGTGTDVRSDLYSLGATLYHLMTNVPPPDALSRATAVLNGTADPLRSADKVQAQVSEPVARVLMNAMAQSAAKRPPTAAAMREALREANRQTIAFGLSSAVQPIAGVGARQQGTRLAGARSTGQVSDYQPASAGAGSHDVLTVIQPVLPSGQAQPSREHSHARESVVTELRPKRLTATRQRMSVLKISLLASVALIVVAAAIVAFMRPSQAKTQSSQTASSPAGTSTLPPNAPVAVESQAPALSPALSTVPTPSQQAGNQPNTSTQTSPAASGSNAQPESTDTAAAQPKTQGTQSTTDPASAALTPEAERARQADEIRRQRREQDEENIKRLKDEAEKQREREAAERQQQQQLEMIRRQQQPPPPPPPGGFPPPGGGPRPF